VHALDVQELTWEERSWLIAFSGDTCVVAGEELGAVPFARGHNCYDDQPYWHLNCAMRNLQFGIKPGLTIKSKSEVQKNRKLKREEKELWDYIAGKYPAMEPELMASGIDSLTAVATMMNYPQAALHSGRVGGGLRP